jgi:hypothetical protein
MRVPATTTFVSRGRLNGGVLRQRPSAHKRADAPQERTASAPRELDTQAYEALYYRARLILGDSLPRPAR